MNGKNNNTVIELYKEFAGIDKAVDVRCELLCPGMYVVGCPGASVCVFNLEAFLNKKNNKQLCDRLRRRGERINRVLTLVDRTIRKKRRRIIFIVKK